MYKRKLGIAIMLGCAGIGTVMAQSFSFQTDKDKENKNPAFTTPTVPKVDVITPNQYQSQVKALNQQAQDDLSSKIEKMLPKNNKNTLTQPETVKPQTVAPPADTDTTAQPVAPAATPTPSAPPASQAPEYAPAFPAESSGNNAGSASDSSSSTSAPAATSAQPYTGFGGGATASPGSGGSNSGSGNGGGKSSSSGGGWNIKY